MSTQNTNSRLNVFESDIVAALAGGGLCTVGSLLLYSDLGFILLVNVTDADCGTGIECFLECFVFNCVIRF